MAMVRLIVLLLSVPVASSWHRDGRRRMIKRYWKEHAQPHWKDFKRAWKNWDNWDPLHWANRGKGYCPQSRELNECRHRIDAERRKTQRAASDSQDAKASATQLKANILEEKRKHSVVEKKLQRENAACGREQQRLQIEIKTLKDSSAKKQQSLQIEINALKDEKSKWMSAKNRREKIPAEIKCETDLEAAKRTLSLCREDLLRLHQAIDHSKKDSMSKSRDEVDKLKAELASSETVRLNLMKEVVALERTLSGLQDTSALNGVSLAMSLIVGLLGTLFTGYCRVERLKGEVKSKQTELIAAQTQLANLEGEFRDELGEMIKVRGPSGTLGSDFSFRIFDEKLEQETVRFIKVQCPGVRHADVFVNIIFNGCVVIIRRQASRGVEQVTWEKRFQFRPSDGLFEFKEDQALLDHGYLQLVFRAYPFQTRVFRFPQHFDLTKTDVDRVWVFPADAAGGCIRDAEPSTRGTAPARLECAAEEQQPCEHPSQRMETSTHPFDSTHVEGVQDLLGATVATATPVTPTGPPNDTIPQSSACAPSESEPAGVDFDVECSPPQVVATGGVNSPPVCSASEASAGGFEKVPNFQNGGLASSSSAASSSGFTKVEPTY